MTVQAEILNLLQTLRRDTGMTMILVSHDMNTVAHLCDIALLIKQGGIEQRLDRAQLRTVIAPTPMAAINITSTVPTVHFSETR